MPRAIWNGKILAEADDNDVEIVEGNIYFPRSAVQSQYLVPSQHHTTCPWKGEANYHTIEVDGERNENAAWYYPHPKEAAKQITDHIAFWKGVKIEK